MENSYSSKPNYPYPYIAKYCTASLLSKDSGISDDESACSATATGSAESSELLIKGLN